MIDASSVINFYNADALDAICKLEGARFVLCPLVIGECSAGCVAKLIELRERGDITWLDDTQIPAELYLDLLETYGLGEGETESLAAGRVLGMGLCCDDKQARTVASDLIGQDKVIGSAGVLKLCVEEGCVDCQLANEIFALMRIAGGFLPTLPSTYFCDGVVC